MATTTNPAAKIGRTDGSRRASRARLAGAARRQRGGLMTGIGLILTGLQLAFSALLLWAALSDPTLGCQGLSYRDPVTGREARHASSVCERILGP